MLLGGPVGAAEEIVVWRHQTGDAEMAASAASVARFNSRQSRWQVRVEAIPQGSYSQAVTAAALAGRLPCALTLDQPQVPNFADAGHIRPMVRALRPDGVDALIAGARTVYRDQLYAVGQFDVALALFARASVLQKHGIRVAHAAQPYGAVEFREILRRLKQAGVRYPLDANAQLGGEWAAYAFSPWLVSGGAGLVDPRNPTRAEGVLNSDAALRVVDYYQTLFAERLAPRKPVDDRAFAAGRAVFHFTGSWSAAEYRQRFGDDLLALPVPDFGAGPRIGAGSWQWAIGSRCAHPEAARDFIAHLIRTDEIVAFSDATGLMPTSADAADRSQHFRVGAFGRTFFDFARTQAVARPATPLYPLISSSFERALQEVREGSDSAQALDRAVEAIEAATRRQQRRGGA
jgi:multiple sugar transport system substrate-binding protein